MSDQASTPLEPWPELPLDAWRQTYATLHQWLQIVGKVQVAQCAWVNHGWHTPLHVNVRGLSTANVPHGTRLFQIAFDFIDHRLIIASTDGQLGGFPLKAQSVASFYDQVMHELQAMDLAVPIHKRPNELPEPVPFDQNHAPGAYDPVYANRFWRVLVQADRVFKQFRARFIGKCSPVHFFWGAPDLAVTRFSGRQAPAHPGGIPNLPDWVTREAYSHEVSSCGFWPGGGVVPYAAFYSYAYPVPEGFERASIQPSEAFYSTDLGEFLLPYDVVRQSPSPDETLLAFLQTTYEAAADLGKWDRKALEQGPNARPPAGAAV